MDKKYHPLTIKYKCAYCGKDSVGHGFIAVQARENPDLPLPCGKCMRDGKDLDKND